MVNTAPHRYICKGNSDGESESCWLDLFTVCTSRARKHLHISDLQQNVARMKHRLTTVLYTFPHPKFDVSFVICNTGKSDQLAGI